MKKFEKPEIQIVVFDNSDIITASDKCMYSYSYGWNGCTSGNAPDVVM